MRIFFYDNNYRYIGSRELIEGEEIPNNATISEVILQDGEEAYYENGAWIIHDIVAIEMSEN